MEQIANKVEMGRIRCKVFAPDRMKSLMHCRVRFARMTATIFMVRAGAVKARLRAAVFPSMDTVASNGALIVADLADRRRYLERLCSKSPVYCPISDGSARPVNLWSTSGQQ
jgi:hypothetical protein